MTTGPINPGDILALEVRDYNFFARAESGVIEQNGRRGISIGPLTPTQNLITRFVTAQQIVGHYKKRKGSVK